MPLEFKHDTLILDASCVITLYASGRAEAILRSVPSTITIAAYVFDREALWYFDGPNSDVRSSRAQIDLQQIVDDGLLTIVDLDSNAEKELYTTFRKRLDSGEAITGAIASQRRWGIVVDERKARNLLQREATHIQQIYTLELIKHWADIQKPSQELIKETIWNVRYRGLYLPSKKHPLFGWWQTYHP